MAEWDSQFGLIDWDGRYWIVRFNGWELIFASKLQAEAYYNQLMGGEPKAPRRDGEAP